jgi:hypothetical protein
MKKLDFLKVSFIIRTDRIHNDESACLHDALS